MAGSKKRHRLRAANPFLTQEEEDYFLKSKGNDTSAGVCKDFADELKRKGLYFSFSSFSV
jgi:hypothetical protein